MDGGDPRAYMVPRPYYTHWERERTARRERDQRGIELLIRMARPAPAFDDMTELRDLVRTAVAMGVGRS
ncbi:hypothetical protein [Nocardiopsis sp. FIRDI 009]|uniref:hypothetical protein n=1 Tax=Nocardiopsis sp. FIRDI 009 TaxID=714197 RepID=UPI000E25B1D4|nr:hypothetical protein [Nocardiopsis sp. FIRDI 009]